MAIYNYVCSIHGAFERRAGYDDSYWPCACGLSSPRQTVYPLTYNIEGRSMPRRDDLASTQEEMGKELKKRGWSADRAIQELRDSKFEKEDGGSYIDTRKMSKTA